MTRDEIMELAQGTAGWNWMDEAHVQRFASVLIAAEREACAQVCDEQGVGRKALEHYAALTYSGATHDCAAAIRARGEK